MIGIGLGLHIGQRGGVRLGGGGTTSWWLAGGVTPVAAYRAIGAESLAASYINLANPGTNDAAAGVDPAFDAASGWAFNGTTQYLDTTVTPASGWSMFVRFSGLDRATVGCIVGATNNTNHFSLITTSTTSLGLFNGTTTTQTGSTAGVTAGVIGTTDDRWLNAVDVGDVGAWSGGALGRSVYVGARNAAGTADQFKATAVQALWIANSRPDAAGVAALVAAMLALDDSSWRPTSLGASLVGWYNPLDASTITESGGAISQISDLSGNDYHLVQATADEMPTYDADGFSATHPAIVLDGTDDSMAAADVPMGVEAFSAFVFGEMHTGAKTNTRLLNYTSDNDAFDGESAESAMWLGSFDNNTQLRGMRVNGTLSTKALRYGLYHRYGSVFDGVNHTLYVDNIAQTSVASTGTLGATGTIRLGAALPNNVTNWGGAVGEMLILNRAPTAAELDEIDKWMLRHWSKIVVCEGDSIVAQPEYGYTYIARPNLLDCYLDNIAIGGSRLDTNGPGGVYPGDLTYRIAVTDGHLPPRRIGQTRILYVAIGANSINPDGAGFADRVGDYCLARKAAGWDKIVLATVLSRTDLAYAAQEPYRIAYNDIIRGTSWQTAHGVDVLCDLAGHVIMGVPNAPTVTPEYFEDDVHPNADGHALLEPIYTAVINSL